MGLKVGITMETMLDKEQETENKKQKLLTISEKEVLQSKTVKPEREDIGKVQIYESEKCYNGKQEEVHIQEWELRD